MYTLRCQCGNYYETTDRDDSVCPTCEAGAQATMAAADAELRARYPGYNSHGLPMHVALDLDLDPDWCERLGDDDYTVDDDAPSGEAQAQLSKLRVLEAHDTNPVLGAPIPGEAVEGWLLLRTTDQRTPTGEPLYFYTSFLHVEGDNEEPGNPERACELYSDTHDSKVAIPQTEAWIRRACSVAALQFGKWEVPMDTWQVCVNSIPDWMLTEDDNTFGDAPTTTDTRYDDYDLPF